MSTGITCTVRIDGVRVADGTAGDAEDAPTALSGLSMDWGRDSTMDQPNPSTLGFLLADAPGGVAFGDVVHVGSRVEVTATGTTYPDPTAPSWPDPGFEAAGPNATDLRNMTVTRTTARVHAGAQALALTRPPKTLGSKQGSVILAPAPFAAPGTDPGAWDAIPATSPGQRWTFGAALLVPPGATVTVRPVLFSGPYANAWTVPASPALTVTGDTSATWRVVSGVVVPDVAGAWVGLAVEVYPWGAAWDAVATTWNGLPAGLTWNDAGTVYLDDVAVMAPAAGTASTVLVFAGRVTDLELSYDDAIPAPLLKVTAVDFTADLDNIDVGDTPWAAEALSARVARILAASMPGVVADIDPSVASIMVSWRDVDRQSAGGMLAELAASVDGILWSATHQVSGPYLQLEDPAARPPAQVLALDGATVRVVPADAGDLVLSACDQEQDPVTWVQAVGDVATRTAVTWLEEGVDAGATIVTERTVTQVDAARETAWGVRAVALSTQLRTAVDATAVAARILARTALGWRVDGVNLDDALTEPGADPAVEVSRLLGLLDGTTRNGALLQLADLPAWAPGAPVDNVYVEGGRYLFEDGRWVLDLVVSDARGIGPSARWNDLPTSAAWSWNAFDPGIAWDELTGVGVDT